MSPLCYYCENNLATRQEFTGRELGRVVGKARATIFCSLKCAAQYGLQRATDRRAEYPKHCEDHGWYEATEEEDFCSKCEDGAPKLEECEKCGGLVSEDDLKYVEVFPGTAEEPPEHERRCGECRDPYDEDDYGRSF